MAHFPTSSPVFLYDYGAEFESLIAPLKRTPAFGGQPIAFCFPDLEDCADTTESKEVPRHTSTRVVYFTVLTVVACMTGYLLGTRMFASFAAPVSEAVAADGATVHSVFLDPMQNWSKVYAMDGLEIVVDAPVLFGDDARARRAADATEAYLTYEVNDLLQTVQIVAHLWDAAIASAAANQQDGLLSIDSNDVLERMGGSPFRMVASVTGEEGEWVELTPTFSLLDTASSGWAMGAFVVDDIPPCAMFKVIFNDDVSPQSRSAWRPQIAAVQMVFDQEAS